MTNPAAAPMQAACINLSQPDNTAYHKGRSLFWQLPWYLAGLPLLRAYCLPVSAIKADLLRLFGARIGKAPYIKPGVKVKFPWHLTIGDYCWIGEDAWIDNLAPVTIGSHVCISQGAYLCTGNHDWTTPNMRLFTRPITLRDGCWVGAKCVVCPGVTLGEGAVLAAGSVAATDIPPFQVWAGNPARFVKLRQLKSTGVLVPTL